MLDNVGRRKKIVNERREVEHIIGLLKESLIKYGVWTGLNYYYSLGFMLAISLIIQIVSGAILLFSFITIDDIIYDELQRSMRETPGMLMYRRIHANGASGYFLIMYMHMMRNYINTSYEKEKLEVWEIGLEIYILSMAVAFIGYVLPWGQMSYWALNVIVIFVTVIPIIGEEILYLVWASGFVTEVVVTRFMGLHVILPLVILSLTGVHIMILHEVGSSRLKKIMEYKIQNWNFYYNYAIKDTLMMIIMMIGYIVIMVIKPEKFLEVDNNMECERCITPKHIVPEWYFLSFYGILKSVPSKTIGFVMLIGAIISLYYIVGNIIKMSIEDKIIIIIIMILLGILGVEESGSYPGTVMGALLIGMYL